LAPPDAALDVPAGDAETAEAKPGADFPNLSLDVPAKDDDEVIDILDMVEEPHSGAGSGTRAPADLEIFDLIEGDVLAREGSSVNLDRPPSDKPSGVDIIA